MASKGQKFNKYTVELKNEILNKYFEGKGTPIDDSPIESWHGLLKKETLYNNNITSIDHYVRLVEEWIDFYNTKRIKNRKK